MWAASGPAGTAAHPTGAPALKAINNPLRPSVNYLGVRNAGTRAVLKLIARRRLRAAERAQCRREDLAEAAGTLQERARAHQQLHRAAARDLKLLLASIVEQRLPCGPVETLDAIAAASDTDPSRVLVRQEVCVVLRGARRTASTVMAVASCAT